MNEEQTWRNQEENPANEYHDIQPLEPQKRLRVWVNQQLNDVIEALTPANYLTEFVRFMRGCDNLSRCYRNHQDLGHIDEIRFEFWQRYQMTVKLKIKPMIKKIKRREIIKHLKQIKMYGEF
jgi:hypothetical protein